MDDAEPYLPATDMPRFIRDMMEFVELTERDVVAIRGSAPIVLRHAEALTVALYERFLALPRSARFFLREEERRHRTVGATQAQPGPLAARDCRGGGDVRVFLLPAQRGTRPQPPR